MYFFKTSLPINNTLKTFEMVFKRTQKSVNLTLKWLTSFLHRHFELKIVNGTYVKVQKINNTTIDHMNEFFDMYDALTKNKKYHLLCIANYDEQCFNLDKKK
jgi:hypothetical protein